ncbi:isochorismatase family protein [Pseudoroseicyclus aestuarii]|uniref:Maleamate amidohydrolase n=1 Tax=Pseudoroseicyclus aestuarii TaxID=1795041 RepID=A0A318STZ0_9RHOB|nr:isochorismatase family protein [Pseudoroseicyclus aestuarii]PYE85340.1 maleamate amidohydrolase [Pseudoroseicyclus aestuarii]
MIESSKTAREMYRDVRANPTKPRFGLGARIAMINVDPQRAYTDVPAFPATAYETDPRQMEHINSVARAVRALGGPVVWTYVAYAEDGADCGVWGTRTDTPDSLQNIKHGSERAQLDPRLEIDPADPVICKRMASAFFETNLGSLLSFHKIDTVIVTGGSTSGCVRTTVVDALSRSLVPVVAEECVADKHESPHFANLYDMAVKYADVMGVDELLEALADRGARDAA